MRGPPAGSDGGRPATYATHLDGRLDETREHSEGWRRSGPFLTIVVQQNRSFSRDNLPSGLAVKQYFLQLKAAACPLDFEDVGVSVFSQNNEDGILMYIFSLIGMRTRRCIEIGCDLSASTVGILEGNTANLICNFGFDGLIVDIDESKTGGDPAFLRAGIDDDEALITPSARDGRPAYYFSPMLVTRGSHDRQHQFDLPRGWFPADEIDLLSIDVDGADILLWKAVDAVAPRAS